jgi:hypothetical protein
MCALLIGQKKFYVSDIWLNLVVYMKNKSWNKWNITAAVIGAAIGWACLGTSYICRAQSVPADLSPDVQEVLTLSRQHMDDSVITNYIFSTGKAYKLSADDIIYLNGQGVSQPVISALLQTSSGPGASTPASAAAPAPAPAPADASAAPATPPPLDESSPAPSDTTPPPAMDEAPPSAPPQAMPSSLVDNFYTEGGLNGALWQVQTPLLASLAAMNGAMVSPLLSFSPSGMQMSGTGGPGQFMGIQSSMAFNAPFTFSAAVVGMAQDATPFDIYFVSPDLQQYLSIDGHLGGRGVRPHGAVTFWGPFGGVRVPTGGGNAPDYGVWVNHTGSGQPIHALGSKIFDHPIAGVPYTVQVSVGPDGVADVILLDANHGILGKHHVPVGTGPFYLVLAGRDGPTYAVWQSVTMTSTGPPVAMAAPAPAPDVAVPPTPTMDYFQGQLAPYGNWVNVPGYGMAWQPAVSPGWRPYYDGGHWEYTDAGYFWQSDYPWGDITFHYGRWAYTDAGWVWVPGYDYAPAWVVWRHDDADGYIGWAPLPPGAVFVDGGWRWHGARVGADFDFGMGVGFFAFVGYDHFWEHNYRPFIVPHDRLVFAFGHSAIVNHYSFNHGVFVNVGLPHDRMVVYTHRDIHPVAIADMRHQEEVHHAIIRDNDVHSYHPGAQPNAWGHAQGGGPGGHAPQGNQGGHQQGGNQGGHQNNNWGH